MRRDASGYEGFLVLAPVGQSPAGDILTHDGAETRAERDGDAVIVRDPHGLLVAHDQAVVGIEPEEPDR